MKLLKSTYYLLVTFVCCFGSNYCLGQSNFVKDSLRIKVYTTLEYVDSRVKEIKVKKVFCDYCSTNQIDALKEQARMMAYYDRYNPKSRLVDGMRKFAIIIRVSKKDFSEMRTKKDSINN